MQTAAINHRVADFLKQHAPFQAMEEADLLALVAHGRVKFHESDECICWQGTPHNPFVYVIQQGTVSLWEASAGHEHLRDIRGAGDLLGGERFSGAEQYSYTAKSTSDVVIYALDAGDFAVVLAKYPQASRYLSVQASVTADYQALDRRRAAHQSYIHDVVPPRAALTCKDEDSVRAAVSHLLSAGSSAIAVVGADSQISGIVTVDGVMRRIAEGGEFAGISADVMNPNPCIAAPDATVSECVLMMAEAGADAVAITENGSPAGRLHALVTSADLAPAFLDHPLEILRAIRRAPTTDALRWLHQRARSFLLETLLTASSVDWLARLAHRIDVTMLERVIELFAPSEAGYCWCFYGASGRAECLTPMLPHIAVILPDQSPEQSDDAPFTAKFLEVQAALEQCGYVRRQTQHFDAGFVCAPRAEWQQRFRNWIEDPVRSKIFDARPLFDLRPVHGDVRLWEELATLTAKWVDVEKGFAQLLANDCLANLPPVTFFQDLVIEESGAQDEVFHLERSALRPLVDVGRVFGIAAGRPLSGSTLERFQTARSLLPEHDALFREAAEAFRVTLYHQARAGIRQRDDGSQLPPALLSRYDRQVFKSCFRSIQRLLELTETCPWLENAELA